MSEEIQNKLIKYIQEYRTENINLTTNIQVLQFKVDLAKKVVELFGGEKGSDKQIAGKNKKFVSYRADEYVDYDKAFIITGEMENDRKSYNRLMEILDVAVSDRENDFNNFDINPYVEQAEKVVEDYTRRTQGTPNYLDQNDNDLVAMELLYRIESES